MAGHIVPPNAGCCAGLPELSEDKVKEAPLPAVEGAANGSAIASTERQQERQQRQHRKHCFTTRFYGLIRLMRPVSLPTIDRFEFPQYMFWFVALLVVVVSLSQSLWFPLSFLLFKTIPTTTTTMKAAMIKTTTANNKDSNNSNAVVCMKDTTRNLVFDPKGNDNNSNSNNHDNSNGVTACIS